MERASKLEGECSHLSHELKLVKTQVLEGNYKVDNFDSIKRLVGSPDTDPLLGGCGLGREMLSVRS